MAPLKITLQNKATTSHQIEKIYLGTLWKVIKNTAIRGKILGNLLCIVIGYIGLTLIPISDCGAVIED